MIKRLKEMDVKDKTVIVRVDYNVPVENGTITSTKKIDDSFDTIDYLVKNDAKIVLLSHFGRVKNESDKKDNSLEPVYEYIKGLNKYDIIFSPDAMSDEFDDIVESLKPKQIVLAENTRFLDLQGDLESGCDIQLSMSWAHLADIYIDDAFGSMHRDHASITGIPRFLPSAIGFLVEKEIDNLNKIIKDVERPFVVLMGGAKLDDKIELIYSLAEKADYILLGGGIANTFLKASGYNVGASLVSDNCLDMAKQIMQEFPDKIILPKDVITCPTYNENYDLKRISEVEENDVIGDIGSAAIANYTRIIDSAKTIFVNGTVGMYEKNGFANGTREMLDIITKANAFKVVGGGDATSALKKFGYEGKVDFASTGGGATLKYIADGTLVGLKAIEESNEKLK